MQGYRLTMEDAHDVKVSENEDLAVFGVFDGHGGDDIARALKDTLVTAIFRAFNTLLHTTPDAPLLAFTKKMKDCFFQVDSNLPQDLASNCGSTAIITAIVANRFIILANTGDSRAILSLPGGAPKTLLFDHKPSTMGERVRIENSGGYVINGRVNEVLALSRAFGDLSFKLPWLSLGPTGRHNAYLESNRHLMKKSLVALPPELFQVSVEPDVLVYDLTYLNLPEFVILACDGIWDCFTNDQLIQLIRKKLCDGWDLKRITSYVLNECISMANNITGIGFDNMTLIIVALHPHKPLDYWFSQFG